MFHIAAAALVLPKSNDKGLNPSLDFVLIILKCCRIDITFRKKEKERVHTKRTWGRYEIGSPIITIPEITFVTQS